MITASVIKGLISKIYIAQYVYNAFGFQKLLTCETHLSTD